jgi:diadenosine tetraphosphate (Ap4A) HIT family hydrolase
MHELPPILETDASLVTQCRDCDFPGYLILRPKQKAERFADAPLFAAELGGLLSVLEDAIIQVTQAARVYVLRFSEAQSSVHFHLLPRTDDIARRYANAMDRTLDHLIGPEIFEWVRQLTHIADGASMSPQTKSTAEAIRAIVKARVNRWQGGQT